MKILINHAAILMRARFQMGYTLLTNGLQIGAAAPDGVMEGRKPDVVARTKTGHQVGNKRKSAVREKPQEVFYKQILLKGL